MKILIRYIILSVVCGFLIGCEKDEAITIENVAVEIEEELITSVQSNADDSQITQGIKDSYYYLSSYFAQRSSQDIDLPQDKVDKYYYSFIRLYNATSLYCRDSILSIYKSHFYFSSWYVDYVSYLYVEVDSAESWHKEWIKGNLVTGNNELDILIAKYGFESIEYQNNKNTYANYYTGDTLYNLDKSQQPFFVLRNYEYINMVNFAEQLRNIKGVLYAETNHKYWFPFPSIHYSLDNVYLQESENKVTLTFVPSYS